MIEKQERRICPECGAIYQQKKMTPIALSELSVDMTCENGHSWREYYHLNYTGFSYKGKNYCSYGIPLMKGEEDV